MNFWDFTRTQMAASLEDENNVELLRFKAGSGKNELGQKRD